MTLIDYGIMAGNDIPWPERGGAQGEIPIALPLVNIDWGDELRKAAASASVCRAELTTFCWLLCVASSPDPVEEVPDQEIIYRTVGSNSTCI